MMGGPPAHEEQGHPCYGQAVTGATGATNHWLPPARHEARWDRGPLRNWSAWVRERVRVGLRGFHWCRSSVVLAPIAVAQPCDTRGMVLCGDTVFVNSVGILLAILV